MNSTMAKINSFCRIQEERHLRCIGRLLRSKKLILMVDLDNTVLHSAKNKVEGADQCDDIISWKSNNRLKWRMTKIRPHARQFLSNMSHLFEMSIFTNAGTRYAKRMAKILDADGHLFRNRIYTSEDLMLNDCTSKSSYLADMFPYGDDMVVIIDDREDVWNSALNLIQVQPYEFFLEDSENKTIVPDLDHDNYLPYLETLLRRAHCEFFAKFSQYKMSNGLPFPNTKLIVPRIIQKNSKRQ